MSRGVVAQARYRAPNTQLEEQNMIDLAIALSMCETATQDAKARPSCPGRAQQPLAVTPVEKRFQRLVTRIDPTKQFHIMWESLQKPDGRVLPQLYSARTSSGRVRTCAACNKPFSKTAWSIHGGQPLVKVLEVKGRLYHADCVSCKACGKPIRGGAFLTDRKGNIFHEECHKRKYGVICSCCHERITPVGRRVEYIHNRFWNEKYCVKHSGDGSVSCTGCSRLRAPNSDDIASLGDGRSICLECLSTIVTDSAAAQPLYQEVLNFYKSLGMPLLETPPLVLSEHDGLNEAAHREGRNDSSGPTTHTRGLCLVEHVARVKQGSIIRDDSGTLTSSSSMIPLRRDRNCVVVAILVLAGLPRVVTGAVIAHEVMHAWLRQHGVRKLPPQVEEGLCQLMSYLWLEAQQLEDDVLQARLASYVGYQIRTHPSEIYGKGFAMALDAYQNFDLTTLLSHVKKAHAFPLR